jgi:nucleotide-binding universal stress UspA family protein
MIEKILFPVDFSTSSVGMAAYVKRVAALFGSQVSLLHVCDLESHNGFELYVRSFQEISEEHWSVARRKLDSFLESEFPLDRHPRILSSGEAASQIAEAARTDGFDLIVMPTHAGRFRKMLLGSTTAKVLNDADSPVMTSEHAEMIVPRPLEHKQWTCAIGLSEDSERVLRLASRAAIHAGAKLSLIHVLRGRAASFHSNYEEELESEREARRLLNELQEKAGCAAAVRIAVGPIKQTLLETARGCDADALIIGRKPSSDAVGRIRDLTYSLIRDAPFPVLSV